MDETRPPSNSVSCVAPPIGMAEHAPDTTASSWQANVDAGKSKRTINR